MCEGVVGYRLSFILYVHSGAFTSSPPGPPHTYLSHTFATVTNTIITQVVFTDHREKYINNNMAHGGGVEGEGEGDVEVKGHKSCLSTQIPTILTKPYF